MAFSSYGLLSGATQCLLTFRTSGQAPRNIGNRLSLAVGDKARTARSSTPARVGATRPGVAQPAFARPAGRAFARARQGRRARREGGARSAGAARRPADYTCGAETMVGPSSGFDGEARRAGGMGRGAGTALGPRRSAPSRKPVLPPGDGVAARPGGRAQQPTVARASREAPGASPPRRAVLPGGALTGPKPRAAGAGRRRARRRRCGQGRAL